MTKTDWNTHMFFISIYVLTGLSLVIFLDGKDKYYAFIPFAVFLIHQLFTAIVHIDSGDLEKHLWILYVFTPFAVMYKMYSDAFNKEPMLFEKIEKLIFKPTVKSYLDPSKIEVTESKNEIIISVGGLKDSLVITFSDDKSKANPILLEALRVTLMKKDKVWE